MVGAMTNLPDDWGMYYATCDRCGQRYHPADEMCNCAPCAECGDLVAAGDPGDDVLCEPCKEVVLGKCKELCIGCRDDFYNGKNHLGIKECWMYKTASIVSRTRVGIWQNPPYQWQPQATLSCHQPDGSVWMKSDDVRIRKEADRG